MKRILCFGDSITAGRGENPNTGWVGRLKQDVEKTDFYDHVYNLGIPGDNSTDLLKRFDTECKARINFKRDNKFLILVAIGTNDARLYLDNNPETSQEKYKKNIQQLIKKSKSYQAETVFIGLTPIDEERTQPFDDKSKFEAKRVQEFNEIVKETCSKEKIQFIDLFDKLTEKDLADGVHPNSQCYEKMYEIVKEKINKFNHSQT